RVGLVQQREQYVTALLLDERHDLEQDLGIFPGEAGALLLHPLEGEGGLSVGTRCDELTNTGELFAHSIHRGGGDIEPLTSDDRQIARTHSGPETRDESALSRDDDERPFDR